MKTKAKELGIFFSVSLQDLVTSLLVLDPKRRMTAAQAMRHPWVKGFAYNAEHMEATMENIKLFNARRKLKVCHISLLWLYKREDNLFLVKSAFFLTLLEFS